MERGSQPLEVPPSLKDLKSGPFGLGSGDGCKDIMIVGELEGIGFFIFYGAK